MENDTLKLDSNFQHCDSVFIATFSGTACCVSGPTVAKPGDTLRYHYQVNHVAHNISWEILGDDISIIAGQDTHTVTVRFGSNFSSGSIHVTRLECSDYVKVTSN